MVWCSVVWYGMTFTNDVFLSSCIELRALATLLGPYGMKYLGDRMLQQIASQMGEVKVRDNFVSKIIRAVSDTRPTKKRLLLDL